MAETLSPRRTAALKQRAPVLSPERPLFLGSNDDKMERAQARAARAAAIRRKPVASNQATDASTTNPCLGQEQIMELFQNCIKLASENKINQKNTWELNLIDHLCDIIKVEEENDVETNFQKASCTLEAGVRIYSMRVDSVHSEAYKVLGGISRVAQDSEQDNAEEGNTDNIQVEGTSRKQKEQKLSPLTTLESSFEALNVKKFDVAFAVDPLYHQTTAQFDEGGSKGLLLNNLGVYGGCRMVFDSLEVPVKCMSLSNDHDKTDTIDISFARDSIEQMVSNFSKKLEITPTLKHIVNMFDEDNKRPADTFSSCQTSVEPDCEAHDDNEFNGDGHDNSENFDFINDNQTSLNDEGTYEGEDELFIPVHHEDNEPYVSHDGDVDDKSPNVDSFLFLSLGLTGKQNAWAGPDHWKYRKTKVSFAAPEDPEKESGSPLIPKKQRNKKQAEPDIEFLKALELDTDMGNIFAPPKNAKTLLLPANREPCNTTLPEDCHYQPEDLVKLFLLPNILCLGKKGRRCSDEPTHEEQGNNETYASWDDEGGQFDDGNAYSDVEDSTTLVSQPRQVNKIEVEYDKTSKQVDVQALKETLWSSMQETQETKTLSFKDLLTSFPGDKKPAAASLDMISPHLCFICVLHLANEHGLRIVGCVDLDDLTINLP
ncbi:condensin complex subunit 2-like [Rutidosis leptorrhynchoides]|uniref:condensin complex subunit 2-like n=1 Tax=Rutidosis leptorrhynchoides TaxID=125765 RepID=UPI003A9969F7